MGPPIPLCLQDANDWFPGRWACLTMETLCGALSPLSPCPSCPEVRISQGTCTDLQLQTCQTRRRGVHPSRSLPPAILRRLSIRIASTGRRRPSHLRTVGYRTGHIQSTSVTRLPLHEHRQGIGSWRGCLSFRGSVRLLDFTFTMSLTVTLDSWNPGPASHSNLTRNKGQRLSQSTPLIGKTSNLNSSLKNTRNTTTIPGLRSVAAQDMAMMSNLSSLLVST